MNERAEKIFVAGHRGMVGSAIVRALRARASFDLLTAPRSELDLTDAGAVKTFLRRERPDVVVLAAAKVGGIHANRRFPADFLRENLAIQTNVIHQAHEAGVRRLVFLGSSCIYPRACPQPMREESLLTGPLEPTNEAYAVAKIAGLSMAQAYHRQHGLEVICPVPCNLYGTNDTFDLERAHVLSALVRRFCDAVDAGQTDVTLWGTGQARREFLHVDDLAEAILLLMERWASPDIVNVGSGHDLTIRALAGIVAEATGFGGRITWDTSMPDGMPRKCLDVSRLAALGFRPRIALREGVARTVREYRERRGAAGGRST
jgi:GDP-L-fucose synthase